VPIGGGPPVIDFKLPELGENVTAGDVLRVLVKPGDTLAKDQPILELETDKATIEVPSSVVGQVKEIKVKAGDTVKVGQSILSLEEDGAGATTRGAAESPEAAPESPRAAASPAKAEAVKPEPPKGQAQRSQPAADATGEEARAAAQARANNVVDISRGARAPAGSTSPELPAAPAAPSVRKLARELGVNIDQVPGTGPDGRISIDDVKAYAKRLVTAPAAPAREGAEPLPDFSRWGAIDRQPMRAVRRKTAQHLTAAWTEIPHVTQHDYADITTLDELRHRYAKQAEAAGGALTVTAIAVKVVASALKVFPQFNSSIDTAADEIIYKKYVNIGVAVDTDRGLLVPVIRNADTKNITQLSVELSELSEKARTRKISLDEMQGGCFSISNLGGIGGSFFTPIVNTPEVAILGISRAKMEPVHDPQSGGFVPRLLLPLSLSYDHRVIDGADAVRFLRWMVEAFERPFLLALQG
jgi:pyruvate dehydrogenase E2 component (dihydrolipoamide acetyltransferase)